LTITDSLLRDFLHRTHVIVYPPSFKTLGILPFNINPHYIDSQENKSHMGETRETRINEFHHFNSIPVIGLREGSWIEKKGNQITLKGKLNARIFQQNKKTFEIETGTDLSELN
jgi:dipeptidase E